MKTQCAICGKSVEETFTMSQADDGTWTEKKDGTLPSYRDKEACVDCADELEKELSAFPQPGEKHDYEID